MSGFGGHAPGQALAGEVGATLTQLAVAGRSAFVIAMVFDADGGLSHGAFSPTMTADELTAAAEQLERFVLDTRARALAARS